MSVEKIVAKFIREEAMKRGRETPMFGALLVCASFPITLSTWCWQNPSCYCSGRKPISISCIKVQDVVDIRNLLRNHPVAWRLKVAGNFSTVPDRFFEGFSASILLIDAPLEENLTSDWLGGLQKLKNLTLKNARFEKVPSLRNLKVYQLTRGTLTVIENHFQNKSATTHIVLARNKISRVNPDAFQGTLNLEVLDISWNWLSNLDPNVFAPLKVLKIIRLAYNFLHSLDGCFGNVNPQVIDLHGNNLSDLSRTFNRSIWTVKELNLGGNPLLQLSASVFNGTMASLGKLLVANSGLSEVEPDLLKFLPKLYELSLSGNKLVTLPKNFFQHNLNLRTVRLSDNSLRSVNSTFDLHRRSKWYLIALDNNRIESVSFGDYFSGADHLDLSRNEVSSTLLDQNLNHVTNLNLSSNDIQELGNKSFDSILFMKALDLSNNPLESFNGSLRNMKSLIKLYLGSACLTSLNADELEGSEMIKLIDLHNNSLSSLRKAFIGLEHLNRLDISSNNLSTLTLDDFCPRKKRPFSFTVWMENNPWACDCRLNWIVGWKNIHLKDDPLCASPARLAGQKIRDLNETDLDRWVDGCPASCECFCHSDGEAVGTEVDCSAKKLIQFPDTFPSNAWTVDVGFNGLDSFDGQNVLALKQLKHLDLESNRIKNVMNLQSMSWVSSLRLTGNELRTFPLEDLKTQVYLSRNPWRCDCSAWNFRNWLIKNNDSILDLTEVCCGPDEASSVRGRRIDTLTREDFCPEVAVWKIVLFSAVAIVLLLCVVFCVCRQAILACCYFHGCRCLKAGSEREPMAYDVFLLYSDEEQRTAVEISRALEGGKHHFNVCYPSRDIPVPRTPEKVSAYMQQCEKIIVLMSRVVTRQVHLHMACLEGPHKCYSKEIVATQ